MTEKYPRPWHASQDRHEPLMADFADRADRELMHVHDAGGQYLFTIAGAEKAKDILLIVNGGDYEFKIEYAFTPLGAPQLPKPR